MSGWRGDSVFSAYESNQYRLSGFLGIGAAVMGDGNFDLVYEMADTDRKMMKAAGKTLCMVLR